MQVREQASSGKQPWNSEVRISSTATTDELKSLIEKLSSIPAGNQKLLCMGKWLKDGVTLKEQGIKSGSKLMVSKIATTEQKEKIKQEENEASKIMRLTEAATQLAQRSEDSESDSRTFELVNQNGVRFDLPAADEQALKVGMALHEKGKSFQKKGDIKSAYELFSEAEKSFSKW